jgi:hypothetical protein
MKHQLQKFFARHNIFQIKSAHFKTCAKLHKCRETSVVDQYRFDADPDPDPNVHADPTPFLHTLEDRNFYCNSQFTSSFQYLKFFGKKNGL